MMKKIKTLLAVALISFQLQAQDAKAILKMSQTNYARIKDYSCAVNLNFDIPGLNIEAIDGTIFFKKPNKFRIKTKGIVFLPKQNPNQIPQIINDTVNFIPFLVGKETISGQSTDIVQMIPVKENDVVAAKFYINKKGQILKAQISTKDNGTSDITNSYDENYAFIMPSKTTISFDMKKFKMPKMVSVDINRKTNKSRNDSNKTSGSVVMQFSHYKFNQNLDDAVFVEKE